MNCLSKAILRLVAFSMVAAFVTSCAYEDEKIALAYEPTLFSSQLREREDLNVEVEVKDVRRLKTCIGRKIGSHGEQAAQIKLNGNLKEMVFDAVNSELVNRGFRVQPGEIQVKIEIERFFNDFKPASVFATSVAELVLKVMVIRGDGSIAYAKTITGEGTHEKIWAYSGHNAKVPLDLAFNNAIHTLFNDLDFVRGIQGRD